MKWVDVSAISLLFSGSEWFLASGVASGLFFFVDFGEVNTMLSQSVSLDQDTRYHLSMPAPMIMVAHRAISAANMLHPCPRACAASPPPSSY